MIMMGLGVVFICFCFFNLVELFSINLEMGGSLVVEIGFHCFSQSSLSFHQVRHRNLILTHHRFHFNLVRKGRQLVDQSCCSFSCDGLMGSEFLFLLLSLFCDGLAFQICIVLIFRIIDVFRVLNWGHGFRQDLMQRRRLLGTLPFSKPASLCILFVKFRLCSHHFDKIGVQSGTNSSLVSSRSSQPREEISLIRS